jgi:hypothetical protein
MAQAPKPQTVEEMLEAVEKATEMAIARTQGSGEH